MGTRSPAAPAQGPPPPPLHGQDRVTLEKPAELLTCGLSAGTQAQSSPDLQNLAFTGGELGHLLQFHLLNVVKEVVCE